MKYFRLLVLLLLIAVCFAGCNPRGGNKASDNSGGLNRNPTHIRYSKHARCRMDCRNITQNEIVDLIHRGYINYKKCNLTGDECHKRYAIEGYEQNAKLRIIVAECGNEATVITCIDLDHDWPCTCPGDERHH